MWRAARAATTPRVARDRRSAARCCGITIALALMNACTLFALVGIQHLGAVVPVGAGVERRHRPQRRDDERLRRRQCRSACGSATSRSASSATPSGRKRTLRRVPAARGRARPGLHVDVASRWVLLALGPVTAFFATGLLQRLRRGDGRALSDRSARDRAGLHLQHRPHRQRVSRRGSSAARRAARTAIPRRCRSPPRRSCSPSVFWIFIPETKGRQRSIHFVICRHRAPAHQVVQRHRVAGVHVARRPTSSPTRAWRISSSGSSGSTQKTSSDIWPWIETGWMRLMMAVRVPLSMGPEILEE